MTSKNFKLKKVEKTKFVFEVSCSDTKTIHGKYQLDPCYLFEMLRIFLRGINVSRKRKKRNERKIILVKRKRKPKVPSSFSPAEVDFHHTFGKIDWTNKKLIFSGDEKNCLEIERVTCK